MHSVGEEIHLVQHTKSFSTAVMKVPTYCLVFLGCLLFSVSASNDNHTLNVTESPFLDINGTKNSPTLLEIENSLMENVTGSNSTVPPDGKTTTTAHKPRKSTLISDNVPTEPGKNTSTIKSAPTLPTEPGKNTSTIKSAITPKPAAENSNKSIVYNILIALLIFIAVAVLCFFVCKKKKGYNIDYHEDAALPLSTMNQDAFESTSPKDTAPELKTFTAAETNAVARNSTADAHRVKVEDEEGEMGTSVKDSSSSKQTTLKPPDQPAEQLKDANASTKTSMESLKDSDVGTDEPKAEVAQSAPAENYSEVRLDEAV